MTLDQMRTAARNKIKGAYRLRPDGQEYAQILVDGARTLEDIHKVINYVLEIGTHAAKDELAYLNRQIAQCSSA